MSRNIQLPIFAIILSLLLVGSVSAQRRGSSSPLDTLGGDVSQADGLEILNTFRRLGVVGEYRLNFQLRVMPRRDKTRHVSGLLLGTQSQYGPLTRVDVALEAADVSERGELIPAKVKRLLLQNGLFANAIEANSWETEEGEGEGKSVLWQVVDSSRYFEPLAESDFTVFDLLMPFSFWQEFLYEGRTTLRSRPVHVFTLYPPSEDKGLSERISKVRIYLDEEFSALNKVEIYNVEETLSKTITVMAFKLVDSQAVLSQVDVRNEETRDKTRFRVLDAALGIDAPDWVFTPEGLERDIYGTELSTLRSLPKSEDAEAE